MVCGKTILMFHNSASPLEAANHLAKVFCNFGGFTPCTNGLRKCYYEDVQLWNLVFHSVSFSREGPPIW